MITGAKAPVIYFGGARRDRTADPLHAMQVLSQLSYSPKSLANLRDYNDRVKSLH